MEDKNKNKEKGQQIENNNQTMIDINPTISVITSIINDLNTPIKDRLSEWVIYHTVFKKHILNIKTHTD